MKIVVLSKGYEATLGISRSLKAGGYNNIDLLFIGESNGQIALASNVFVKKTIIATRCDEEIVQKLLELYTSMSEKEKIVLFPGDDYTTSLVDRYCEKLESIFLMTYVDGHKPGGLTALMDKKFQAETAPKYGLRTAKSWTAHCLNNCFVIPEEITYPCFVKPLVSANGLAKANMAKCSDKSELSAHLKKLADKGQTSPVIIQEFIEITEEFNIHGICDGDRLFLPIIHKKIETAKYSKGVTILGKNLTPDELEPELTKLKTFLLSLGYHGIFNVEMFRSGEKTYLNEINVRIAGTCWGATGAGANIPVLWVQCLLGELSDWPELDVKFNTVFLNDKTAYEDYVFGMRTKKEFDKWNKTAEYHLIMNEQDKEPWKVFKKMMLKRQIKNKIKKIIRRS